LVPWLLRRVDGGARARGGDELVWAAVIAAAIVVQKILPLGEVSARLMGVGLLVSAVAVAAT
jgi:hypothetical protein